MNERQPTPCANPACTFLIIGAWSFYRMDPEVRKARNLRSHDGYGYCQPCRQRMLRRGTLERARLGGRPSFKAPTTCACGKLVATKAYRDAHPDEADIHPIGGRGRCWPCYRQAQADGTLDDLERRARTNEEVVEEYEELRLAGNFDLHLIAERMGMTWVALDKALWRARQRGDERAALPHRDLRARAS
jgi:hypothetical protein